MTIARRKFRFIKEIAEGGFGKVYLAEQLSADGFARIVAIKLLHAKWSSHDEVVMRTRDEARLLGLIRHQAIVKVEDLTSIDGKCALVMEYLEGVDMKAVSSYLKERNQPFPRQALFEAMLGVCSALDAAYNGQMGHDRREPLRVIHRDIKPSNIFLTVNGQVKVLDFGTARANFAEREAKTQALAFGSQGYMAPERMLGEEDTPKADVFSLGVTLYEMMTLDSFGRIPPRPNKFLAKVQERVAAIPLDGDPDWQEQVRDTVRSMLAYDAAERPSAAELVDRFEVLAQNAKDAALRKFCRVEVAAAKAAEPELNSGDPLLHQTIDEDLSNAFGTLGGISEPMPNSLGNEPIPDGVRGGATPAPVSRAATPPPAPSARGATPAPAPASAPPPPRSKNEDASAHSSSAFQPATPAPAPKAAPKSAPKLDAAAVEDAPAKGGGMGRIVVILVVLLILLGGGALLLVVVGGGVAAVATGTVQAPSTGTTEAPTPEEPVKEEPKLPDGGKIVKTDDRKDVARSKTVLEGFADKGAKVVVQNATGFKAEWDGKSDFDLGDLPEGKYRTTVTPVGGETARNKTFEVVGKKACKFKFDVGKQEWNGSCS